MTVFDTWGYDIITSRPCKDPRHAWWFRVRATMGCRVENGMGDPMARCRVWEVPEVHYGRIKCSLRELVMLFYCSEETYMSIRGVGRSYDRYASLPRHLFPVAQSLLTEYFIHGPSATREWIPDMPWVPDVMGEMDLAAMYLRHRGEEHDVGRRVSGLANRVYKRTSVPSACFLSLYIVSGLQAVETCKQKLENLLHVNGTLTHALAWVDLASGYHARRVRLNMILQHWKGFPNLLRHASPHEAGAVCKVMQKEPLLQWPPLSVGTGAYDGK